MRLFLALLLGVVLAVGIAQRVEAQDARKQWFESQTLNEATRQRLGVQYKSCCDGGDVYRTQFRVVDDGTKHGAETWFYQHKQTGEWRPIHPDIIKDEASIDEEPILFINKYDGKELCFFPPKGGI
jgi:hypothetical protein